MAGTLSFPPLVASLAPIQGGEMSTRAIVKVTDGRDTYSLYCHGDGYPEYLGKRIRAFCHLAPYLDGNHPTNADQRAYRKIADLHEWPNRPRYYGRVATYNVASEACKFVAILSAFLWQKGYCGAYLTQRDGRQEAAEDWTDIEWQYEIELPSLLLTVYEADWTTKGFRPHTADICKV